MKKRRKCRFYLKLYDLKTSQIIRENRATLLTQSGAIYYVTPESVGINVQALIAEELRRLHEGVLARYGLRPPEVAREYK